MIEGLFTKDNEGNEALVYGRVNGWIYVIYIDKVMWFMEGME